MSTLVPAAWTDHLASLDRLIRREWLVVGCARWLICGMLLLAGLLSLDSAVALPPVVRQVELLGFLLLMGGLAWRWMIRPQRRLRDPVLLAAVIEHRFPELRERLLSVVELAAEPEPPASRGVSRTMQHLLKRQTARWATNYNSARVLNARRSSLWIAAATTLAIASVIGLLLWGSGAELALSRLLRPYRDLGWGARFQLQVLGGDQVVARGQLVLVRTVVRGLHAQPPDTLPVQLEMTAADGPLPSIPCALNPATKSFVAQVPDVFRSFNYRVTSPGAASPWFHVEVVDAARVTQADWRISPPASTLYPPQRESHFPLRLTMWVDSQIDLTMQFSSPVRSVELFWPMLADANRAAAPATAAPVESATGEPASGASSSTGRWIQGHLLAGGLTATVRCTAQSDGPYYVRWTDARGPVINETSREVVLRRDGDPRIDWIDGGGPLQSTPRGQVPLEVLVTDDVGASSIELHSVWPDGQTVIQPTKVKLVPTERYQLKYLLDLGQQSLVDGQKVRVRGRVADTGLGRAPHEAFTTWREITIGQVETAQSLTEEFRKEISDQLIMARADLASEQATLEEHHQNATRESMKKEPKRTPPAISEVLERQAELDAAVQSIERQLNAQTLQAPVAAAVGQSRNELEQAAEALRKAEQAKPRDRVERLSQSLDHLGQADAQLERAQQQLAQQREIADDLQQLPDLADAAQRLVARGKQASDAEDRSELGRESAALAARIDQLIERRPELAEAAAAAEARSRQTRTQRVAELEDRQRGLNQDSLLAPPQEQLLSPKETFRAASEFRDVTVAQSRLAREALEQAVDLASKIGADADATSQAVSFAEQALQAATELRAGRTKAAAGTCNGACKSGQAVPAALGSTGQAAAANPAASAESQRAERLARQQQRLTEQLDRLQREPGAEAGARDAAQQQLAQEADELAGQMAAVARQQQKAAAAKAGSSDAAPANNEQAVASELAKAADAMRESSQQLDRDGAQRSGQQAANHLQAANQQLAEAATSDAGQRADGKVGAGKPGTGKPDASQTAGTSKPGEGTSTTGVAQRVPPALGQQAVAAARALRDASARLQPRSEPPRDGSSDPSQPDPASNSAEPMPAVGEPSPQGQANQGQGAAVQGQANSGQPADKPPVTRQTTAAASSESQAGPAQAGISAQAQQQLVAAAQELAAAAEQVVSRPTGGQSGRGARGPRSGIPSTAPETSKGPDATAEGPREPEREAAGDPLASLKTALQQKESRNWGKLPGTLRTEILQGASRAPHPEYEPQIKHYFEQIARPASPVAPPPRRESTP